MTFDEFVDICKREPVTSEDDLIKAFRKIDINGDGYISLDELFKIMTSVNWKCIKLGYFKNERHSNLQVKPSKILDSGEGGEE